MAVVNAGQLQDVLARPGAFGRCLARHAYGMGVWVDLIGAKLALFTRPEDKALAARLVADNARHMLLFRARAHEEGVDPDAYRCTPEGEAIYAHLRALEDPGEVVAFALGSLDHFAELLEIYARAAPRESLAVVRQVAADVEEHRAGLRSLLGKAGQDPRAEAGRLYAVRELVEADAYATPGR
jgi:hypothetical protein